jgi:hypothetical protein
MEFDFEAWAKLARDNPAEFERRREAVLREIIESAPARHRTRLQGLQFQIDMERQRSGSALGACLKLNSMMWASFFKLREALDGAVNGPAREAPPKASAEVIPMHRFVRNRSAAATGEN